MGVSPDDSSGYSASEPNANEGELRWRKLTRNQLIHKYLNAMSADQKRRYKANASNLYPYKCDLEDFERFIMQFNNVWVLQYYKYEKVITKILNLANPLQKNRIDKHRDPVKMYEAYHPKCAQASAHRL